MNAAALNKRFAVALPWVETQTADHEFAQHLCRAAANLGLQCVLVDRYGNDLKSGQKVRGSELDFVINTHFICPKVLDSFSLLFMNLPVKHYYHWGYQHSIAQLMSHDDFLSTGSQGAANQVQRSLSHEPLHLPPGLLLYCAMAEPVIEPKVMQRRLVYINANWDKERHRELRQQLDRRDLIDFYGSASYDQSGYRNYKGELPFDGRAVMEKLSEAGAALALSSEAHIRDGMLTSRLYEALAAGAVVISDWHPFAREHFGDTLLYVDTDRADATEQIAEHVEWMNAHPERAAEMAGEAQKIFRQRFSADVCLKNIYEQLEERKKALQFGLDPTDANNPLVRVLCLLTDPSEQGWQRLRDFCQGQDYHRMQLQLLLEPGQQIDRKFAAAVKKREIELKVQRVEGLTERSTAEVGSVLAEGVRQALKEDDFEHLCVLTSAEQPFSNHLSSLVRLLKARPDCTVAATAEVFHDVDAQHEEDYDHLRSQASFNFATNLDEHPIGFARFLIRRQLLDESLLSLLPELNRKAMAALVVGRDAVQSSLATVLVDPGAPFFRQPTDAWREDLLIRQAHPSFAPSILQVESSLQGIRYQLDSLTAGVGRHRDELGQRQRRRRRRRRANAVLLVALLAGAVWWLVG